jgi:hypothetical protein
MLRLIHTFKSFILILLFLNVPLCLFAFDIMTV